MALALSEKAFSVSAPSVSLELTVIWLSLGSARKLVPTKHAKDQTVQHRIHWTLCWLVSTWRAPTIRFAVPMEAMETTDLIDWLIDWLKLKIEKKRKYIRPFIFWDCIHQTQARQTAAVFYPTLSGCSARSSLYSRQAGIYASEMTCIVSCGALNSTRSLRFLVLPSAYPRRICVVTRGFQTTTQDLAAFPFIPRQYHMTHVISPFITTVWTPVVLAIINYIIRLR